MTKPLYQEKSYILESKKVHRLITRRCDQVCEDLKLYSEEVRPSVQKYRNWFFVQQAWIISALEEGNKVQIWYIKYKDQAQCQKVIDFCVNWRVSFVNKNGVFVPYGLKYSLNIFYFIIRNQIVQYLHKVNAFRLAPRHKQGVRHKVWRCEDECAKAIQHLWLLSALITRVARKKNIARRQQSYENSNN